MDQKIYIENLLKSLKQKGYTRSDIEKELNYSENYIDQALTRPKISSRFFNAIKAFHDGVLQKATIGNKEYLLMESQPQTSYDKIFNQQNKLLVALQQQSETANRILQHLSDNVETKIVEIDTNLKDALGRVDSLKYDLLSGRTVVLQSLARLEKKPEDSLLHEADSIIVSLLSGQSEKQGKSVSKNRRRN